MNPFKDKISRIHTLEYLSEENYVKQAKHHAPICPNCRKENLESTDNITIFDDSVESEVMCKDCNSSWIEVFGLVGYYGVEPYRKEKS